MNKRKRHESIAVSAPVGPGLRAGIVGEGTPENVERVERLIARTAQEFTARCPGLDIRIVRKEVAAGKTFGYSHIPDDLWRGIFRNGESGQARPNPDGQA